MVERDQPALIDSATEFSRALTVYQFEQEDLVNRIADKPVLAVQYDLKRPNEQLATSTIRALFDKGFGARWSIAANGAVEFYNDDPPPTVPRRSHALGLDLWSDLPYFVAPPEPARHRPAVLARGRDEHREPGPGHAAHGLPRLR